MEIVSSYSDRYVTQIRQSGLTIYDIIPQGSPLYIPDQILQEILKEKIYGISLQGLPLRTRSKYLKECVCQALGYPIPATFKKSQPRFPGQNFDTYAQKSTNLQIWNEEISPPRRYVIINISESDIIEGVRVLSGVELAQYDRTGTLTHKLQAICSLSNSPFELVSQNDTAVISSLCKHIQSQSIQNCSNKLPTCTPSITELLPISSLFSYLSQIIGYNFNDTGVTQERNRGTILQQLSCKAIGYRHYADSGQFPDIPNQLLEIKLQTSPTIDLGVVNPSSHDLIPDFQGALPGVRYCDVRYAIFFAQVTGDIVTLTHLILTTGEDFFKRFPQCQGNMVNSKIQIPLPRNFWE